MQTVKKTLSDLIEELADAMNEKGVNHIMEGLYYNDTASEYILTFWTDIGKPKGWVQFKSKERNGCFLKAIKYYKAL